MKKICNFILLFLLVLIPLKVDASEMSAEFAAMLTDEGKVELNSVHFTDPVDAEIALRKYFEPYETSDSYISVECNNDATICTVKIIDLENNFLNVPREQHDVPVIYKTVNNTIKEKVKEFADAIPQGKVFKLIDMEVINFWLSGYEEAAGDALNMSIINNMGNYSGELKKHLKNSNISVSFDFRRGDDADLMSLALGYGIFKYDNIATYIKGEFGTAAENVIYVPNDTENTKEALMLAAQNRINEYLGNNTDVVLSYGGLINTLEYYDVMQEEIDGYYSFLSDIDNNFYFLANIGDGVTHKLVIKRDSTKMNNPTYKTIDLSTNIEISSNDSSIPLDTTIKSTTDIDEVTVEKILKALNITDADIYDLKLFSNSLNENFTQLEDGTFRVKIPLKEEYKDKKLMAYYVREDGKILEYEVEIEDGYAIFYTDHFSIYSLVPIANINNPKTLDNISMYYLIGFIAIIGLLITSLYFKKRKINSNI